MATHPLLSLSQTSDCRRDQKQHKCRNGKPRETRHGFKTKERQKSE
jgi:hypothetical protein